MVTHSCHQVKLICVRRPWKRLITTRLVDPWGLIRCYNARSGRRARRPLRTRPVRRGRRSTVAPPNRGATEPAERRELLSAGDVARTVARMAHQVIERTSLGAADAPPVVLLGIPTRGAPIAARLAERIADFSGITVPTGVLDVTLYRDDLRRKPTRPLGATALPKTGIEDHLVILDRKSTRLNSSHLGISYAVFC